MSETQALVPIEPTPGMTLLAGYHLTLQAGPQDDAYAMDDAELANLDDVKIRPTRLRMDGTTGQYRTSEMEKTKDGPPEVVGVILDKLDNSQVLFPKDNEAGQQIWPEEGGGYPDWICRADSVNGVPRLHPDLTDKQRELLRTLKVNGATEAGNCTTCIHAQFRGDTNPTCSGARNLLVFDQLTGEPSLLQVKGTSIKFADKHLAGYKKKKRALYADVVTLGSRAEVDGARKWRVMTFTVKAEAGPDAAGFFREIRRTMTPLLTEEMRSGRNLILGTDEEITPDHVPPPPVPVGDALPPVDPGGTVGPDDVPF